MSFDHKVLLRPVLVLCVGTASWVLRGQSAWGVGEETSTYGPTGFGSTVQVWGARNGTQSPIRETEEKSQSPGYEGATVVSDTYGGVAVWVGAGVGPGQQVGCSSGQGVIQAPSATPNGSVLYVLVNQQGIPIGSDTVACTPGPGGAAVAPPPPPPPTGAQVWSAEAQSWQNLVSSGINANPGTLGLTGLSSWFWLTNATTTLVAAPATVDGYTVTASASIVSYTWTFGDGYSATAYGPGTASSPAATHTYGTKGGYTITVVAHYVGTFTFSGFGIRPRTEPFAIDVTMGTLSYGVQEIRSVLVSPGAQQ